MRLKRLIKHGVVIHLVCLYSLLNEKGCRHTVSEMIDDYANYMKEENIMQTSSLVRKFCLKSRLYIYPWEKESLIMNYTVRQSKIVTP